MSLLDADIAWTRLGDCYAVTKKPRGLNTESIEAIPFAAMEAIPQGGAYEPTFTMKEPRAISSGTYFERGDILVSKITPSFENGKQALVGALPQAFGYATTEVIPLRPSIEGQDPRLLFFYLLHPDIRHHVAERMEGSTGRQRVPEAVLLDLPVPVIELQDQTAMADALERIQAAVAAERTAEATAQELKRAAMRELFTRGLRREAQKETEIGRVPESWAVVAFSDLGEIVTGTTPPTKERAYYDDGVIPFISPGDIDHGFPIASTQKHITDSGLAVSRALPAGTTCVVCIGSTIGKVGRSTAAASATNQQINAIVPGTGYDPNYLSHLLTYHSNIVRNAASPSPVPILSKGAFEKLALVTSTSPDEQTEIAAILDTLDRKIALHRQKRAVLEELFRSLLHKLMTGEIRVTDLDLSALGTPTVREGEPA